MMVRQTIKGTRRFELRHHIAQSGIKYKSDMHFESVPILLDLHPFHGGFRITGGVYF